MFSFGAGCADSIVVYSFALFPQFCFPDGIEVYTERPPNPSFHVNVVSSGVASVHLVVFDCLTIDL
jgi:hypothetical protein